MGRLLAAQLLVKVIEAWASDMTGEFELASPWEEVSRVSSATECLQKDSKRVPPAMIITDFG